MDSSTIHILFTHKCICAGGWIGVGMCLYSVFINNQQNYSVAVCKYSVLGEEVARPRDNKPSKSHHHFKACLPGFQPAARPQALVKVCDQKDECVLQCW